MSSLLLTVLTGLLSCAFLVSPVHGTVNCTAEVIECMNASRILTPNDLNIVCSGQAARRACLNNMVSQCQSDRVDDGLNSYEYLCNKSSELSTHLTSCVIEKQTIIDAITDDCIAGLNKDDACWFVEFRKCSSQSLYACCPDACDIQDKFLYLGGVTSLPDQCTWNEDMGYCSTNSDTPQCVQPSR